MSDLDALRDLQAEYAAARANGERADFTGWLLRHNRLFVMNSHRSHVRR